MASKSETSSQPIVTWSQKFTDFAFVLESGEELNCHKYILVKNSEVFESMLAQEMEEKMTNRVKMGHYSEEAVFSFLEYLYAEPLHSVKGLEQVKDKMDPNKYIFKRSFEEEKLTPELLSMAHIYQVKDLLMDCTQHLKETICQANVIDVWTVANRCNIKELCKEALEHLVNKRPKGKSLQDVPGFDAAFEPQNKQLLKDLLNKLTEKADNISQLQENNLKKNSDNVEKWRHIKITVTRTHMGHDWTDDFYVKPNDKISTLIWEIGNRIGRRNLLRLSKSSDNLSRLNINRTFWEYEIGVHGSDHKLYLWFGDCS